MPYRSEKIKLSGLQDRRRKLTDEQKDEIRRLYAEGKGSWKALADKYHVSKKTVGLIVNSDLAKRVSRYNEEHWKQYQQHGEEWAAVQREHRHYKQRLYLKGELHEAPDTRSPWSAFLHHPPSPRR